MTEAGSADVTIARRLLRTCRQGSLATLMPDGSPYASLVAAATLPDASPLLLVSRLAVHTRNLLADGRASLLLGEAGPGDPLQKPRIMVAAKAEPLQGEEAAVARRRYLAAHPGAALFVDFPDFVLARLSPTNVHLVAGFGRIRDLAAEEVLTNVKNARALLDAEEGAITHLNEDHADALQLYATRLCGAPHADWRCTGLDPDGLDLSDGERALRLDFAHRVTTPGALRKTLVALAEQARQFRR